MESYIITINKYLEYCKKQKKLSSHSLRAYRIDMTQFVLFTKENYPEARCVTDITKQLLQAYINELPRKYAVKTCKRKIASLKAFLNHLEYEDIIDVNPMRKIRIEIKEPRTLPKSLKLSDIQQMLNFLYLLKRDKLSTYAYFSICRAIAILEILFATGIRVGELCSMTLEEIDMDSTQIRVKGKGQKERIVYITAKETLDSIRVFMRLRRATKTSNPHLFVNYNGRRMKTSCVRRMMKKLSQRCLGGKRVTPHMFRHTFASLLLEEGVDIRFIQEFLGHSSISTTQIYLHLSSAAKIAVIQAKSPRLKLQVITS